MKSKVVNDIDLSDDSDSKASETNIKSSEVLVRGTSRGILNQQSFLRSTVRKDFSEGNNKMYELMKNYLENDEATLMESIVTHLEFTLARTRFSIDKKSAYLSAAFAVRDRLIESWNDSQIVIRQVNPKRVYYLSIEYLMGRAFQNALISMGIEENMRKALKTVGLNIEEVLEQEHDPGLGNGGLGRLASCYLDSMATLNLPAWGYGLRYNFGIFKQSIVNGNQIEIPDYWLGDRNPWEIERSDLTYQVYFGGHVQKEHRDGREVSTWVHSDVVLAKAFDNPIPGFQTRNTINLRLWKSIPDKKFDFHKFNSGDYYGVIDSTQDAEMITSVLYPNDATQNGRELRLKQQYFFVSATVQDIIRRFIRDNKDLNLLPSKVAIQLNDTHPSLTIVELLRILVDLHDMEFKTAWDLVSRTFSYTNHTILPEALEKWSVDLLQKNLPRHLELIYLINHHFMQDIGQRFPGQHDKMSRLSLIEESVPKQVRMANLSIHGSHKVNGVSQLHTEILKNSTFNDFFELDNSKFVNVTNGVTPRRWIAEANKPLAELYFDTLGSNDFLINLEDVKTLKDKLSDSAFLANWKVVKNKAKAKLINWVRHHYHIKLSDNLLFDVMVKRIHEYKRQLMYCLHVLHRYIAIKKASKEEKQHFVPRAFIMGGKAAPGYFLAKKIIKLAYSVADLVNNDKETTPFLKFVYLPNYCVSMAELLVPAADVSEHISVAGTEASGTSNMKFALNGCLIIGTMDGANIEISRDIGEDNMFVFGKRLHEVASAKSAMRSTSFDDYFPLELKEVIREIQTGILGDPQNFKDLIDSFTHNNDNYLVGADFADYLRAQQRVDDLYRNQNEWTKKSILAAINSTHFTSDRSVSEYASNIW
jgi:starch phosphorylase